MYWNRYGTLDTLGRFDNYKFPFDKIYLDMTLGAWSYSAQHLTYSLATA